jgi:hypothetical protein
MRCRQLVIKLIPITTKRILSVLNSLFLVMTIFKVSIRLSFFDEVSAVLHIDGRKNCTSCQTPFVCIAKTCYILKKEYVIHQVVQWNSIFLFNKSVFVLSFFISHIHLDRETLLCDTLQALTFAHQTVEDSW